MFASLPGGFSGVSHVKRLPECVVFVSDDTGTVASIIWVSSKYLTVLQGWGGRGQMCSSSENN